MQIDENINILSIQLSSCKGFQLPLIYLETKEYSSRAYCVIGMKEFYPSFNISNEVMTIQRLNSNFKRSKRSAVFGVKFSKKKKKVFIE